MTTHAGPTWYDVLGVAPEASTEQIRVAWRAATADLDPTDRRFATLSEAAAVLLDDERRAAYDREIGVSAEVGDAPAEPAGTPEESAEDADGDGAGASVPVTPAEPTRRRRGVPAWLLVALAITGALLVAAAALVARLPGAEDVVETSTSYGPNRVEEPASEAQAAAERAIGPILSYDHQTLEADQAAAHRFMTDDYREQDYDPLFEVIKDNAPGTQTVVETTVVDSGVVRWDPDSPDRVQVLLFVDRPTTNAQNPEPLVYQDQVTVTMLRVGEEWLVDDLLTTPVGE